jgi:hypothetical protein
MALTRDTTAPIIPTDLTSGGSSKTACTLPFVCKASEAYRIGDIVVLASGAADAVDTAQADGVIIGVAVQAKTAGAAVASSDTVFIACALPGASFTGSLVGGAATDHTPSATTATAQGVIQGIYDTVLGTDAYSAFILINQADTTGGGVGSIAQIIPIRYSDQQLRGQKFVLGVQTLLNPRVDFVFRTSYFQVIA